MSTAKPTRQERFLANPRVNPRDGTPVKIGSPSWKELAEHYGTPKVPSPESGNLIGVYNGKWKDLLKAGYTEDELLSNKKVQPRVKVGDEYYTMERVQEWKAYWEKDHKKILREEEKVRVARKKEAEAKAEAKRKAAEEKKNKKVVQEKNDKSEESEKSEEVVKKSKNEKEVIVKKSKK